MAIGYEGFVTIGGELVLATSGSAPKQRNRIDSQAGYKGSIGGSGGMGLPHAYDFPSYDGSLTVEVSETLLANQLKNWIISDRDTSKEITLQSRFANAGAGIQRLPECYWTSISFDSSQGSAITSNVSFISWKKYVNSSGTTEYTTAVDSYSSNRLGYITALGLGELAPGGDIPALNPSGSNANPIPWWRSSVNGFSGTGIVKPISWSLSFTQEVTRTFLCGAQTTPQPPSIVQIGPITGQLQVEFAVVNGSFAVLDNINSVNVVIGSNVFNIGNIQLGNHADDVKDVQGQSSVALTYDIYGPLS